MFVTCILLENQVHSPACVSPSSKSVCKIAFLLSIFAAFLVVLGPFLAQNEEFDNIYPKLLCQSMKKTSLTIIITAFFTAYVTTAQSLAAKIHLKRPLLDQN